MVSLDISKAYNLVWRYRALNISNNKIANGHMFRYLYNFLNERQFEVKISNSLSNLYIQKNGVPQDSSLAVTIFLLAIKNIVETINPCYHQFIRR